MEASFEFEMLDMAKLNELNGLFLNSFGVSPHPHFFEHKYSRNPAGKATVFVARHEGNVVASYSIIPEEFIIGGTKTVLYQSVDTMTHSDFRRRGLFMALAQKTYEYRKSHDGFFTAFGFPGDTSYPGFVKNLNWRDLTKFKYYFLAKGMYRITSKAFAGKTDCTVKEFYNFESTFDSYFQQKATSVKPIYRFLNREIAHWKFAQHIIGFSLMKVEAQGKLIGWCAFSVDDIGRAFISIVDFLNPELTNLYLGSVLRHIFCLRKVKTIFTFCSKGSMLEQALKSYAFISNPVSKGPFSYRIPLIIYGNDYLNGIDLYDPTNWDVQPFLRDY